jgi:hypothetical protein
MIRAGIIPALNGDDSVEAGMHPEASEESLS